MVKTRFSLYLQCMTTKRSYSYVLLFEYNFKVEGND